jgi:hypothetical protein
MIHYYKSSYDSSFVSVALRPQTLVGCNHLQSLQTTEESSALSQLSKFDRDPREKSSFGLRPTTVRSAELSAPDPTIYQRRNRRKWVSASALFSTPIERINWANSLRFQETRHPLALCRGTRNILMITSVGPQCPPQCRHPREGFLCFWMSSLMSIYNVFLSFE